MSKGYVRRKRFNELLLAATLVLLLAAAFYSSLSNEAIATLRTARDMHFKDIDFEIHWSTSAPAINQAELFKFASPLKIDWGGCAVLPAYATIENWPEHRVYYLNTFNHNGQLTYFISSSRDINGAIENATQIGDIVGNEKFTKGHLIGVLISAEQFELLQEAGYTVLP